MKLEDIARLAGVSKAAVSLALNGKQGISEETRERILQLAEENGYKRKSRGNAAAEPGKKSLTFLAFANSGIVLEQYYEQPFFRELIHYIEERCRLGGYSLVYTSLDLEQMNDQVQAFGEELQSSGVILLGTNLNAAQISTIVEQLPVPVVVLDSCVETLPVHFVAINNVMGAYQAGKHLCELGHKRIGYIGSNVRMHNFDERRRGFMTALEASGLTVAETDSLAVAPTILSSQEALKQQLSECLASGTALPSAFFCECDYIAISAVKTLGELGYRVPEDVSIVGFDNISEARIVTPELTTVHVEKERLAHLSVDLVIQAIDAAVRTTTKTTIDTQFVVRGSSSAPGAGRV